MTGERWAQMVMAASMAAFVFHDVLSRDVAATMSVWQFMLLRSILVAGMVGVFLAARGPGASQPISKPFWAVARSAAYGLTYASFIASLVVLPVTQAAATFFASPLILLLLARVFMGETFGIYRTIAIVLGFSGVIVVIQPWDAELTLFAFVPLLAAILNAIGTAITRARLGEDDPMTLTLVMNIFNMQMGLLGLAVAGFLALEIADPGLATLARPWSEPSPWHWTALLAIALIHIVATATFTRAYQAAPASSIAPFEYSYLVFAPLVDIALTGTPPSLTTLIGVALIAFAGVLAAKRDPEAAASPVAASTSTFALDEEALETPNDGAARAQAGRD